MVDKEDVGGVMQNQVHSKERLYGIWKGIFNRLKFESHGKYYIKKGVKICDEWADYKVFREWSLNNGYSKSLSIDRIDNNGDYTPENCRWVDMYVQANNKSNNVYYEYNGKSLTAAQWEREIGIKHATISARVRKGWSVEDALTKPIRKITGIHK